MGRDKNFNLEMVLMIFVLTKTTMPDKEQILNA